VGPASKVVFDLQPLQTPTACRPSLTTSGRARQSQGNNPFPLVLGPPPPRPRWSAAPLLGGDGHTQAYTSSLAYVSMGEPAVVSRSGPCGAQCGGRGAQGGAERSSTDRGGSSPRPVMIGHDKEKSRSHGHNGGGGQPTPTGG
jgi:hypothetical protein